MVSERREKEVSRIKLMVGSSRLMLTVYLFLYIFYVLNFISGTNISGRKQLPWESIV